MDRRTQPEPGQENIGPQETGYGVCFTLAEGGNIYMQTGADAILLDVDPDAQLGRAADRGRHPAPTSRASQLWVLPDDKLVQLIIGLSSLVASTTLVSRPQFWLAQPEDGSYSR